MFEMVKIWVFVSVCLSGFSFFFFIFSTSTPWRMKKKKKIKAAPTAGGRRSCTVGMLRLLFDISPPYLRGGGCVMWDITHTHTHTETHVPFFLFLGLCHTWCVRVSPPNIFIIIIME
ncbi:hypothetical protein TCDM_02239 [Trypanosoma cruzi Dm28c]|uniref:Uncharacterized protein n=1 Tax=Trypanosoma cruzi Dm28c TaxID=1416333 RepID=V5B6U7_TRYCR|nr:hypothetical protein TCDM_02239 [Trypanosoma cruzi Dm28c]